MGKRRKTGSELRWTMDKLAAEAGHEPKLRRAQSLLNRAKVDTPDDIASQLGAVKEQLVSNKLHHLRTCLKRALVAAKRKECRGANRSIKRLEAKGELTEKLQAELTKLQSRLEWLKDMEGDTLADYAVRPPKEWAKLDGRQQGALQKLLADGEVAAQLRLLVDGSAAGADPTAKPKAKKRDRNADKKKDAAADKARAEAKKGAGGIAATAKATELTRQADREPKRRRLRSPPPTDMVGDSDEARSGNTGPSRNGTVPTARSTPGLDGDDSDSEGGEGGGAGQYSLDQYANFGMDDNNDGMFMSSLSGAAQQASEQPDSAGPQPKKRKNRPGQMARQKKAALKHGQEATHVKDKTRDANLKQSQRKAGQYRREAKQKEREKAERAAAAENGDGDVGGGGGGGYAGTDLAHPSAVPVVEKLHPSWAAKQAGSEAAIKPFEGKKITFDD